MTLWPYSFPPPLPPRMALHLSHFALPSPLAPLLVLKNRVKPHFCRFRVYRLDSHFSLVRTLLFVFPFSDSLLASSSPPTRLPVLLCRPGPLALLPLALLPLAPPSHLPALPTFLMLVKLRCQFTLPASPSSRPNPLVLSSALPLALHAHPSHLFMPALPRPARPAPPRRTLQPTNPLLARRPHRPTPNTHLPRTKPLLKAKPPTRWERFAC